MTADTPKFVTLVSGLPRSGTSMMMQMLDEGGLPILTDRERAADDDNPRGYCELEAVKRTKDDASWLTGAPGMAVKVIYWLLKDLPDSHQYRVLLMQRSINEIIASQSVMLARRGEAGANVSAEQLERIFVKELDSTKRWIASQKNFEVLEIQYSDVLTDTLGQAENIRCFLDLPLDVVAMAKSVDQNLYRQRS
jgi:hypothetical protein